MIREIQYLRAVAALMVVFYHTIPQLQRMGYTGNTYQVLSSGVDIFFVISGFIMTYISFGKAETAVAFLRNRIIRIVPLYWILTIFVAVVGLTVPDVLQSSVVNAPHTIASLLFIPMAHPVNGHLFPLLQTGWTLNYEMYFYLVFSLFLRAVSSWRHVWTVLAITVATLAFSLAPSNDLTKFYGNFIVMEFCFGIGLGWLYCAHRKVFTFEYAGWGGYSIMAFGFAILIVFWIIFPSGSHLLCVGLPSSIIVGGALVASTSKRPLISTILEKIGDASYSLYLSHFIVMSAIGQASRKILGTSIGAPMRIAFIIYATLICILVAVLIYEFCETPLRRAFRRGKIGKPVVQT